MPSTMAVVKPDYLAVAKTTKADVPQSSVVSIPFDVWSTVVAHVRTTDPNPRVVITRMMATCRHFRAMFEFFLYDRLHLVGPHTQVREDVIMLGWKQDYVSYSLAQLHMRSDLRDSVADLVLSRWGCPRCPGAEIEHAVHHCFFDTILALLPTFSRLSLLHLIHVTLDLPGLRLLQSLSQVETLYMDECSVVAFGLDELEFVKPHALSPVHVVITDLGWSSNLRAAPLLNFSRVRHFNTSSSALLHALVNYADLADTDLALVDVNLAVAPRGYRFANPSMINSDRYGRKEMTSLVNRLLRRAPRVLRLRAPIWLENGLEPLTESCPLLHSYYGSVRSAKAVMHNRLMTTVSVWTNEFNRDDGVEELKELTQALEEQRVLLPPIFIYRGFDVPISVLDVLELIAPVASKIEWLDIELSKTEMTYPYEFCQIFRRYGNALPLLSHFAFGLFHVRGLDPRDAFKAYNCWVTQTLAEWCLYCPNLVSMQLGRLAHWELGWDDAWRSKLLANEDFFWM